MSDLREQLAACIVRVWGGVPNPHGLGWSVAQDTADECIRQMEWARSLRGEAWRGDGRDGTRHIIDLDEEPLTAAPDDWRPE